MKRTLIFGVVLASLSAFVVAPLLPFVGFYELDLLIRMMILALFGLSFNLLFGYTGLLSFGHASFFGLAGYGLGIVLTENLVVTVDSFLVGLLMAVGVVVGYSVVVGYLCVQRDELLFAMLTLAFNMLLFIIARQWSSLTGGEDGLIVSQMDIDLLVYSFSTTDTASYYYFVLAIVLISTVVLWRIVNSPYGQLLQAVRENNERAEFVGLPVSRYQWSSFVISGAFAGLAGALIAPRNFVMSPSSLHWSVSADPVLVTLIGGPYVFAGPILGAFVFVGLEETLTGFVKYWRFGLGLILVPLVLYFRSGILGYLLNENKPYWEAAKERIRERLY